MTFLHRCQKFSYDKNTTHPQYTRSRYDNYKRDSRSHRSPNRSSYRSPYRRDSRPRYRSRSSSRDKNFQRYTSSFRPPSRPRDPRSSRSRSHSHSRNKLNTIQPQTQNDSINFEVRMYHPTERANAVTPTSWFYSLYTHTPSNQVQQDYPSRLEISFLLDSGASISVLNYATYVTNAKLLNIKHNNTLTSSKTLTVANQTEVFILNYVTLLLNTSIEDKFRQFTIPFEVADIKYNILGTPFFEEYIQNINIQDFTLQFKHQSTQHPNLTKFTSLLSILLIYLSHYSKTQIRLKPNSSKIAHFPIKNYYDLHFTTTPQILFFLQFYTLISLLTFVQLSILLKISLTINQTLVRLVYKILQIMLQLYLLDTLNILKFQLPMKNLNKTKLMILTH